MKVCLLGASFETNNMGVGALTAGTIKIVTSTYENAEIILLDYGKQTIVYDYKMNGTVIPVRLVNMRFSKRFYLKNNIAMLLLIAAICRLIPFERIRSRIIKNNFCLRNINESDLILSISGGDSFSDIYGFRNFLYGTLPQILILLMGKNLILMPQTFGPYSSKLAKKIAVYILNNATHVYSRDYASMIEVKEYPSIASNINERMKFCYDVGFIVDPVIPKNFNMRCIQVQNKKGKFIVGLNISGLLFMDGHVSKNIFTFKINYNDLVYRIIDYLIRRKNANVILIPHVFGSKDHPESDSEICKKVYDHLKNEYGDKLELVRGQYDQNEIKYIIGLCDFFIGSRMHACIAAVSQNIPAISIAYSKKFKGLMDTVEMGTYVIDPNKMNEDSILELIGKAIDERNVIRTRLMAIIPNVKKRVSNLFNEIEDSRLKI